MRLARLEAKNKLVNYNIKHIPHENLQILGKYKIKIKNNIQ